MSSGTKIGKAPPQKPGFFGASPVKDPIPELMSIKKGDRTLLVLDIVDDILVADYKPEDLDEAARIFVDKLQQVWNRR